MVFTEFRFHSGDKTTFYCMGQLLAVSSHRCYLGDNHDWQTYTTVKRANTKLVQGYQAPTFGCIEDQILICTDDQRLHLSKEKKQGKGRRRGK